MSDVYLITGASSDVGVSLIERLNNNNNNCIFLAHYYSSLKKLEDIKMINGNVIHFFQADLSKIEEAKKMICDIQEMKYIPNCIVHLPADKYEFNKIKKLDWEKISHGMEVQIHSLIEIVKAFGNSMTRFENNSKIVLMLSENTIGEPAKYTSEYTILKYALLGFMHSLSADFKGKKININAVSPSMINTKFLSEIDGRYLDMNGLRDAMLEVEEVTEVIEFLLSQQSNNIYDQNIHIRR